MRKHHWYPSVTVLLVGFSLMGIAAAVTAVDAEPSASDTTEVPFAAYDTASGEGVTEPAPAVPDTTTTGEPHPALPVGNDSLSGIAVAGFLGRGVDSSLAWGISNRFSLLLAGNSPLPVIGPVALENILKERGWERQFPCDHNDCFIAMGRMLGVRYLVCGSVAGMADVFTFAVRMLDVESGKVVLFRLEDRRESLPVVLTTFLPELVTEFSNKLAGPHSAAIAVQTDPPDATVILNEAVVGTTPLLLKNVVPGSNQLRIRLEHYRECIDTLLLQKGRTAAKRYTLEFTDEYRRSTGNRARALWVGRGIGLVGSIVSLSMGLYYNAELPGAESELQRIVNEYESAGADADATLYAERYRRQSDEIDTRRTYRNLCYVASIVCAAGVTVTFFF